MAIWKTVDGGSACFSVAPLDEAGHKTEKAVTICVDAGKALDTSALPPNVVSGLAVLYGDKWEKELNKWLDANGRLIGLEKA